MCPEAVRPLQGLKVLEVGRLLPAPLVGTILYDLGAEVIKLEPWPQGDATRATPLFPLLARGKRFLAIPPERWKEAWPSLLSQVDVLILNHLPSTLRHLHLDPAHVQAAFPRLITVNLTGFPDGRPGHDLNFLAESGVLDRLRPAPQAAPIVPGFLLGDLLGGTATALIRLLAALHQRERTGISAYIPIVITTEMLRWSYANAFLYAVGQGTLPPPTQELFSGGFPTYRVYETRDGRYVAVAALEPKFWEGFCHYVGRPDFLSYGLALNDDAAHEAVAVFFRSKTWAEWRDLLAGTAFCVTPVYTFTEAIQQPWAAEVWQGGFLTFSGQAPASWEVPAPGADNAYLSLIHISELTRH